MLDHLDRRTARSQRGAAGRLNAIRNLGRDPHRRRQIGSYKNHARPGRSRTELDRNIAAAPITETGNTDRPPDGALLAERIIQGTSRSMKGLSSIRRYLGTERPG